MIAIAGRRFVGERGSVPGVVPIALVLALLLMKEILLLVVGMLDSYLVEAAVNPDGLSLAGRVKLPVVMSQIPIL